MYSHTHTLAHTFTIQTGEVKCRVHNSSEDSLSCGAWHRSGTKFYVGGQRGQFFECVSKCIKNAFVHAYGACLPAYLGVLCT